MFSAVSGTNFQNTTKRAKTMATATSTATESAMKEPFTNYVEYLNNLVMFLIFHLSRFVNFIA